MLSKHTITVETTSGAFSQMLMKSDLACKTQIKAFLFQQNSVAVQQCNAQLVLWYVLVMYSAVYIQYVYPLLI